MDISGNNINIKNKSLELQIPKTTEHLPIAQTLVNLLPTNPVPSRSDISTPDFTAAWQSTMATPSTSDMQAASSFMESTSNTITCLHCPKLFYSQVKLDLHYGLHHFCKICKIQFNDSQYFYTHILQKHIDISKQPIFCELCYGDNIIDILAHVKSHSYIKIDGSGEPVVMIEGSQMEEDEGPVIVAVNPKPVTKIFNFKPPKPRNITNQILAKAGLTKLPEISNSEIQKEFNIPLHPAQKIYCEKCHDDVTYIPLRKHICSTLTDCFQCNSKFDNKTDLLLHIKASHFKNGCCDICKVEVEKIPDLADHVKNCLIIPNFREPLPKAKKKVITCKHCGLRVDFGHIKEHFARDHQCKLCKKTSYFKNRNELIEHIIINNHFDKLKGVCVFCQREFKNDSLLYKHIKVHWSPTISLGIPPSLEEYQNLMKTASELASRPSSSRQEFKTSVYKPRKSDDSYQPQHEYKPRKPYKPRQQFHNMKPYYQQEYINKNQYKPRQGNQYMRQEQVSCHEHYCFRCDASFLSRENHVLHTKLFHLRDNKCVVCGLPKESMADIVEHANSHALFR